MRISYLLIGAALAINVPAAFAQTQTAPAASESPDAPRTPLDHDRGYDKPSARTEAINASSRDQVAAANNEIKDATASQPTAVVGVAPADQARHDADMAEYRAALRAHSATMADDAAFAARQERAYADAMTAWRIQAVDCRRGVAAACRAPTPRPVDFW